MNKYIMVTADCNDADYVTEEFPITDEEIERVKKILSIIKSYGYAWETGELAYFPSCPEERYVRKGLLTLEDVDFFNNFCPYGSCDYPGIHTIKKVMIFTVLEVLQNGY